MLKYGCRFEGIMYLTDTDDSFFDTDKNIVKCHLNIHNGICSILTDDNLFIEFDCTDVSFYYGDTDSDMLVSVESSLFFYNFTKKKQKILTAGE